MKTTTDLKIEQTQIGDLRLDPANPRRISDAEMEALTRSIQQFGLVDPIIARRQDSTVIGGHQRLVAARRLGLATVPVIYVDLSPEQARLLNVALNKISGSWDQELLARLLADLDATPNIDLSLTGFDDDEIAKLLKNLDAREKRDREETFDLDAAWQEAKADSGVQRGDVWQLGDHRIMCGDSTSEADVASLMAGETARLMVTDPPYGVGYQTDGTNPKFKKRHSTIANDDLGAGQAQFWTDAFGHWPLDGDAYVFGPSGPLIFQLAAALTAAGIDPVSSSYGSRIASSSGARITTIGTSTCCTAGRASPPGTGRAKKTPSGTSRGRRTRRSTPPSNRCPSASALSRIPASQTMSWSTPS